MANDYFSFKQFTILQDKSAFKVGTDGVLLGAAADISHAIKVLDIGSGTGLIALMVAQRCNAIVYAIEPDYASFVQMSHNVNHSKWHDRIRVECTDLQHFNHTGDKFDLILTNPPYFTNSLKCPDLRKTGTRHTDTLNSDDILKEIDRLMTPDGKLQLILPYVEGNLFIAEASRFGLYCNSILKIRPLPSSQIRRLILTFSKTHKNPVGKFLTIEHGRHQFTEEYINLTKEFYLKF